MSRALILPLAIFVVAVFGCNDTSTSSSAGSQSKNQAALEKLAPEDRAVAEKQQRCPVTNEPLGSMGVPIKVMVKDQPVFVCCASCKAKVEAKPDEMLKKVEELKSQTEPK